MRVDRFARVIGDQREGGCTVGWAAGVLWRGLRGDLVAGVVDRYLVVVSKAAEEETIVRDGVVEVPGDFDSFTLLFLE